MGRQRGSSTVVRTGVGALGAVAGAGVACVAYGTLVERERHELRRILVPALPDGADHLTITHLSDLHMTRRDHRQRAFLRDVAGERTDLVVVTGDMLGEPDALALDLTLSTLAEFKPRLGAVAVLGSNDYFSPRPKNYLAYFGDSRKRRRLTERNPWRELVGGLRAQGWQVLFNQHGRVGDIEVAGLDDGHIHRDDPAVLRGPDGPSRLRLGVVHSPYLRDLNAFSRCGYQLVLAGHTHGGQVCLPGVGALVTNCDLPREQARGLSRHGDAWLHVSAGLGTSKYAPFRFACRPEATILDVWPMSDGGR